jgi:hypothetical protein
MYLFYLSMYMSIHLSLHLLHHTAISPITSPLLKNVKSKKAKQSYESSQFRILLLRLDLLNLGIDFLCRLTTASKHPVDLIRHAHINAQIFCKRKHRAGVLLERASDKDYISSGLVEHFLGNVSVGDASDCADK